MKVSEIVLDRVVKATYMGFLMSGESYDDQEKYTATEESIKKFIGIFNGKTDVGFNRIRVERDESKWGELTNIRAIGTSNLLSKDTITMVYSDIENLINSNLERAFTMKEPIQVYDLNTFDLLDRCSWNTMGDKYLSSNNRTYMVNFIHLYNL